MSLLVYEGIFLYRRRHSSRGSGLRRFDRSFVYGSWEDFFLDDNRWRLGLQRLVCHHRLYHLLYYGRCNYLLLNELTRGKEHLDRLDLRQLIQLANLTKLQIGARRRRGDFYGCEHAEGLIQRRTERLGWEEAIATPLARLRSDRRKAPKACPDDLNALIIERSPERGDSTEPRSDLLGRHMGSLREGIT